jgi:hypothetical protein
MRELSYFMEKLSENGKAQLSGGTPGTLEIRRIRESLGP